MRKSFFIAAILIGCSSKEQSPSQLTDSGATAPETSNDSEADTSTGSDAKPPLGEPITAAPEVWTWVGFPSTACDDGSSTGIGVNLTPRGPNVLVFHSGGGACWDPATCFTLHTASAGPFGEAQFTPLSPDLSKGIFDRSNPSNPFKDWSYVFVPYCTGDWHGGDNVASYELGDTIKTYHHEGRKNVRAYVPRLGATFTTPSKVLITGSDGGGFGAMINYDLYRAVWPGAKSYLLDDSGPLLQGDAIPAYMRDAFYSNWRLDKALDAGCPTCKSDLSALVRARATAYPGDRIGLLSTTQDQVIRSFYMLGPTTFEIGLLQLGTDVYEPTARAKYFFVAGDQHTMLLAPTSFSTRGVDALTWLRQMTDDDAAWVSVRP